MTSTAAEIIATARDARSALRHGLRQRCPSCGQGSLFARYLKVNDTCPACGEALHHHRADDIPAYLTVLFVSKIVGTSIPVLWSVLGGAPVAVTLLLGAGATVLMLVLLPRFKGLTVAYQWANRMHGFDAVTPVTLRA